MPLYNIAKRHELLRKAKDIQIPVHGSVSISLMAKCFIDNKYFQRLDKLKQLGTCDFIFPGAKHTRFEHSIGTYHLADRIMTRIKNESDNCNMHEWLSVIPELESHYKMQGSQQGLNRWIIELVKIAALCHDVGHGPYSHVFDDVFIKNSEFKNHPLATHESRSCVIVAQMVRESELLSQFITDDDIKFIQSLIDPEPFREGFIYQIVSNNLNGLDVDKYDYISRDTLHTAIKNGFDHSRLIDSVLVIDNKIVFPEQAEQDIYNLFLTRHSLHRRAYGHKGVVSAQYIITEIMTIVDKVIGIASSIADLDKFIKMTDEYILQYMEFLLEMRDDPLCPFESKLTDNDYKELLRLRERLQTHDLYPHIGTILTREPFDMGDNFNNKDHMIFKNKVGFVSGNKLNPLDRIYVYKTKDLFVNGYNVKAHRINRNDISHIIPEVYQEYITMVFRRDRDPDKIVEDKQMFQQIKDLNKTE